MDHHYLQQLQQQQLLQAQHHHHHHHQQQHFQPPQQPHYHYNSNTHQPYYPPQYQYPQQQPQQNGYHPSNYTNLYPQQAYPQSAVPRPPELPVPPAVAVMSRLVQYSGAVGSQWNTPPMVGQPPYRGIGEVGGELFRGHQGNFGYSGAHPSFIGGSHGRGRGGSWLLVEHGVPSTSSHPPHQTYQSPVTLTPQKSESASALKTEVPNYQKPQVAQKTTVTWCEVCNASCANLDVLKQHQNGKRHQRNLRKMERLKNGIRTVAKLQGQQLCTSNTKLEVPHQTQCEQDDEEKNTTKDIPYEPVGYENSRETGKQNKNPGQPEIPPGDGSDNVKRGKKRKKTKTPKQSVEPSKRKVVIPIVCDLCNVKCDKQAFFDRHLSGKKHVAKYKRFKGHEAMHRTVGLQVLYPPNPLAETIFQPQEGRYIPPHVYQDIQVETSSDPQFQQNPTSEGSESILGCGSSSTITTALETNITTEPEISQEATIEVQHLNSISETGQGSNTFSQD
ncbi:hypothetical protein ABKV19_012781 [Rosa sericea]